MYPDICLKNFTGKKMYANFNDFEKMVEKVGKERSKNINI